MSKKALPWEHPHAERYAERRRQREEGNRELERLQASRRVQWREAWLKLIASYTGRTVEAVDLAVDGRDPASGGTYLIRATMAGGEQLVFGYADFIGTAYLKHERVIEYGLAGEVIAWPPGGDWEVL